MENRQSKKIMVIVSLVIIAVLTISSFSVMLIAKYAKSSNQLENDYTPGVYDTPTINDTVDADADGNFYKSNVIITVGSNDYPEFVRAALVITWQNAQGEVYGQPPVLGDDYSIEYNDADWTLGSDGYYYYNKAVKSGCSTEPLIGADQKLKQTGSAPEGYTMHVEVVAETIQAVGKTSDNITAVMDAWGVQPAD